MLGFNSCTDIGKAACTGEEGYGGEPVLLC